MAVTASFPIRLLFVVVSKEYYLNYFYTHLLRVLVHVCGHTCARAPEWRSENSFQEPGARTRVVRLGSRCLSLPSHVPSQLCLFL